jgi:hypothetical protein
MINEIINIVKNYDSLDFNNKGYKVVGIECKVDINSQKYLLSIIDTNYTEFNFLCTNVNSLNNLLIEYGIEI